MNGTLPTSALQRDTCDSPLNTSQLQTPTSTSSCRSDSSDLATVAAGIAAPLGVLLLASLAALAVLFRQNRSLRRSTSQSTPMSDTPPTSQNAAKDSTGGMEHSMFPRHNRHNHSFSNEAPIEHALAESDGRAVVQELPTRNLGE